LSASRSDEYSRLAALVAATRETVGDQFGKAMVDWLRQHVSFDHCVIFGYRGAARPPLLFETFSPAESHVFVTLYQEGPYLLDPFHHAAVERKEGFWRMRELAPDRFYASEYFRSYYSQTKLAEEVGFFVPLPGKDALVLSLMRLRASGPFGTADARLLRDMAPAVINFGRTRPIEASRSAEAKGSPRATSSRVCEISTRLFCTATPKRPISPTIELAFQVSPASQSA